MPSTNRKELRGIACIYDAFPRPNCCVEGTVRAVSASRVVLSDDRPELGVDAAVRRDDAAAAQVERTTVEVGHHAAGLFDEQHAGSDVPGVQALFPKAVHAAGGDIADVERRRSETAHRPRPRQERGKQSDELLELDRKSVV